LIWNICLERFAQGKSKFNTEEQMLTYSYNKQRYAPGTANPYMNGYGQPRNFTRQVHQIFSLMFGIGQQKKLGELRDFSYKYPIPNPCLGLCQWERSL
jgi:hypothetical protein